MPDEPRDAQPLPPTQADLRAAMRKAIREAPITPEMQARRDRWMLKSQLEARCKDAAELDKPLGHAVRARLRKLGHAVTSWPGRS